ncbi:GntR family transcriptional regulator, partial [Burkholderia sp.]
MASDKLSGERDSGLLAQAKRPTYVEVSSSIEAEIRNGTYPPGSRLPPQRQLATELGINVSTVSRAYKELQLRGLVIGSKRRGSLVTGGAMPSIEPARASLAAGNGVIDLTVNRPATGEFLASLAQTFGTLPNDPRFGTLQEYQPPQGPDWARAAGAQWLAAPGFTPSRDQVVVTSGAQHGLYAVL